MLAVIHLPTSSFFTLVIRALILTIYEESLGLASCPTKRREIRGWRKGKVELSNPLIFSLLSTWSWLCPLSKGHGSYCGAFLIQLHLSSGNCSLLSFQKCMGNLLPSALGCYTLPLFNSFREPL